MRYFQQLKDKALLQIEFIKTQNHELINRINAISTYQVNLLSPKIFASENPDNCIRASELAFEALCTNLEELGVMQPKKLTVFEFYSKIRYFKTKKHK